MSFRWSSWLAAVALVLVTAACGGAGEPDAPAPAVETRTFAGENGEATIPVHPQRVVATGYAVPALIEAGAPLVGISSWTRGVPMMSPEELATYERLDKVAGESAADTNYEAIALADPDLIVIGVPVPVLADVDVERLATLAPVVAVGPTVPSAWRDISRRHADAAGALAGFDAVRAEYEAKAASLREKYAAVVPPLKFGHVGAYGRVTDGTFHREFNGSWGTNVAQDVGANYYGAVENPGPGSKAVSEYPSVEQIGSSLGEADAITYSVEPDGSVPAAVQQVLDSQLWKNLPAVQAGRAFPIRYTEAATYSAALKTLDSIDQAFAPLLGAR
ncbi:ABC transporter substrate-binding protein [Pseudonocardia cypriaca]|uniref:Iron complex transport system substrate-binding protein n=1 Tax=Pseudonocardia cypriaca TaxID=882449 RepID=A0A543GG21_9PSEU|nr:ABC transporter substrate-binding protein [Pseudonocardia cypriaca]TQM45027.1 iron complex transport system substrate-binding protein [Pseudonocardia cypriaca]